MIYKEVSYYIREIDFESNQELEIVTKRCMWTVLETIPEFENDPEKVRKQFKNFSFNEMKAMIKSDFGKENHRLLVALNNKDKLIGQSIFSLKKDEAQVKYGSCFSRYVVPEYRKIGIGSKLLEIAEEWWNKKEAAYVVSQTHIKNYNLRGLFCKMGYEVSEPKQNGCYQYYELKKQLKT